MGALWAVTEWWVALYLNKDRKLLEVQRRIDRLGEQGRHNTGGHNVHGQSVAFIAEHDPVDV